MYAINSKAGVKENVTTTKVIETERTEIKYILQSIEESQITA